MTSRLDLWYFTGVWSSILQTNKQKNKQLSCSLSLLICLQVNLNISLPSLFCSGVHLVRFFFFFSVLYFFSSKIALCFFFISLISLLRLFNFLYLIVFAFTFWGIFIVAWKFLSDNSYICVILALAYIDYLWPHRVEIFLILCMLITFGLYLGHFEYNVMGSWVFVMF